MRAAVVSALGLTCLGLAVLSSPAAAQPPLEALPEILQLDLSQHPAWRAYKDAAAEDKADAAHEAGQVAGLNSLPTPQRLDALMERMQKQQAAFEREAEATKAFYAVLSPEQRQVFDQVTRVPEPPPQQSYRPRPPRYNPPISSLPVPPTQTLPPPGAPPIGPSPQQ